MISHSFQYKLRPNERKNEGDNLQFICTYEGILQLAAGAQCDDLMHADDGQIRAERNRRRKLVHEGDEIIPLKRFFFLLRIPSTFEFSLRI